MTFTENTSHLYYDIKEKFTGKQIQTVSRVSGEYDLSDFENPDIKFDQSPKLETVYRLKLSYDRLENKEMDNIRYTIPVPGGESEEYFIGPIKTVSLNDNDIDPYLPEADGVHFIYETGEIILGEGVYENLRIADNIEISYTKTNFRNGELRPEHYFDCVMTDTKKPEQDPITFIKSKQEIQYEINYNQKLTINTEASEAISHKIGRDIDDILKCVDDVIHTEENK